MNLRWMQKQKFCVDRSCLSMFSFDLSLVRDPEERARSVKRQIKCNVSCSPRGNNPIYPKTAMSSKILESLHCFQKILAK